MLRACLILILLINTAFQQSADKQIIVSPRDFRYFEYSDGTPFIPIGLNLIGVGRMETDSGLALMEEWMKNLSENKGNYIRLWFSDAFWEVEHQKSGEFDEEKAKQRLDKIITLAGKYNLKVKATLDHFRNFNEKPGWDAKPWHNVINGGTAKSMDDFFNGQASRDVFLKKLDWYSARYGSIPNIFIWELWNEVNAVSGAGYTLAQSREQYEWTKFMLPELHNRFPKALATQSLGSFDDERVRETYKAFATIPENDLAQVHRYLDLGAAMGICRGPVDVLAADAVKELLAFDLKKPLLLAESGAVEPKHAGPFKLYAKDKAGMLLHDVLFAPFFAGAAGPGHIWHWSDYVSRNHLWFHFARFAEAVKNIDPLAEGFITSQKVQGRIRVYGLKGKKTTLIWCRDTANTWKSELQNEIQPDLIENFDLDVSNFAAKPRRLRAEIYDPWKDVWYKARITGNKLEIPGFKRSVVVRLSSK